MVSKLHCSLPCVPAPIETLPIASAPVACCGNNPDVPVAPSILVQASVVVTDQDANMLYVYTPPIVDGFPFPNVTRVLTLDLVNVTANMVGNSYTIPKTASGARSLVMTYTAANTTLPNATSIVTRIVPAAVLPVNTVLPQVTGVPQLGQVLTSTVGTWTGTNPITYAYQWQRGVANIAGATASTYTLVQADVSNTIRVRITASNVVSAANVNSASTPTVTTIPSAFQLADWSLVDNPSPAGNQLALTLTGLPFDGASPLTALQWRVGAGAPQTLVGLGLGQRIVNVLANTLASVEVRAVNAIGNGPWSTARTATPTTSVVILPAPLRIGIYGDSFAQRCQDITGAPPMDPQLENWPTNLTTPVGGVSWGFSPWLEGLSRGKYSMPYQINHGIGGFNTGQFARQAPPDNSPFYLANFLARFAAIPVALRPDAFIFQAGTNDGVTTFSPAASYANVVKICREIILAFNVPIFLSTVLPRGNTANAFNQTNHLAVPPGPRYAIVPDQRITWVNAFNALLVSSLAAEPSLNGLVRVIDPRAAFYDPTRVIGTVSENDILDSLVYDGLHLSASAGVRLLASFYRTALDLYFPGIVQGLPGTGGPVTFNTNALMTGTGGTLARSGNAVSNGTFTINGQNVNTLPNIVPDGWTVTTTTSAGATSSWSGIAPATPQGDLTVAKVGAGDDTAIELRFDCDLSLLNNANTRGVEAVTPATLPGSLAVGDYYEGVAVVEVLRRNNLPIAGIRGFSVELRVAEPDLTVRTFRSNRIAPNGTDKLTIEDIEYAGPNALVLRTPPVVRKTGAYGLISFAVLIYTASAGLATDVDVVVRISRAGVIPSL